MRLVDRPGWILGGAAVVVVAAVAAVASDSLRHARRFHRAEQFQTLVGGLGVGPAVDLSHCAYCFDPRHSTGCRENVGELPGGVAFCPYHGFSVLYYPPVPRPLADTSSHPDHALSP